MFVTEGVSDVNRALLNHYDYTWTSAKFSPWYVAASIDKSGCFQDIEQVLGL